LRSLSNTWIVTGRNLREEKDTNIMKNLDFYGHKDIENFFYRRDSNTDEDKKKNVFVLSRKMNYDDFDQIQFFKEDWANKYVFNYNNHLDDNSFFIDNNIKLVMDVSLSEEENLYNSIEFCKDYLKEPILCEIGPTTFKEMLVNKENQHKFDFILISVYTGMLNSKCIGSEFPKLTEIINSGYKLINKSDPIPSEKGELTFLTLINNNTLNKI
jgi:hypothetical protein